MVRISDTLKQQNDLTSFPVAFGDSIWLNKDKSGATEDYSDLQTMYNNDELGNDGSAIQVDLLPHPSVDELGKIYEFIGSTGTYINGYFYECVSDEQNPPTYSWVQKNVQPNAESFTFNEDDFNIDSSTDKVSLLPSRRVFNGSKADWDLLSVAEKTQYGATAFTDDEGVSGNVETISLTQNTNSAYKIIELKAIRMGNIVNVIGIVEVIAQIESLIIATGFPPPLIVQDTVNDTQIYLSGQRGTNNIGQSASITKNGELFVYTSTSGGNYYFSGSYIV